MSEFSRPLALATLGAAPIARAIEATPAERVALARRFDLLALDALVADLRAERIGDGIALTGRVRARGTQPCAVSGLPVAFALDEPLALRFERPPANPADDVELTDADLDTLPIEGDAVDPGEAAAQALGLALDPYPRASDDAIAEYRALLVSEEDAARATNPFAALADRS